MPSSSKADKKAALLALSTDVPPPEGLRPTLLEIDLWRRNKLSRNRSLEVKNHIARDPECYQLWQELLASQQQLSAEKKPALFKIKQQLKNWGLGENNIWLGGGFAVATMALFVAVIGLRSFLNPSMLLGINQDYEQFSSSPTVESWSYKSNDKGISFNPFTSYDLAKTAVSVGIHSGITELQNTGKLNKKEWQSIISQYPSKLPDCPKSLTIELCERQNTLLQDVGRWLALMQLDCSQTSQLKETQYYSLQQQRIEYFVKELKGFPIVEPLKIQLQSWENTTEKTLFCQQIKRVLNNIDE